MSIGLAETKGGIRVKRIKTTALVACVLVGVAGLTIFPTGHRTEAAIAVIDAKNIEEAIKTAIQTANILTQEQKKVLLQVINMKPFDINVQKNFTAEGDAQDRKVMQEILQRKGAANPASTVQAVWTERISNIEGLLNGSITYQDVIEAEAKREKLLHDTYLDAAKAAKMSSENNGTLIANTQGIIMNSNSAEGALQAAQAGNALSAQQIYGIANTTGLLNHLVQMEATKYEKEAVEEVEKLNLAKQNKAAAQTVNDSIDEKKKEAATNQTSLDSAVSDSSFEDIFGVPAGSSW